MSLDFSHLPWRLGDVLVTILLGYLKIDLQKKSLMLECGFRG